MDGLHSPSSTRLGEVPARTIVLSDGQEWAFALPTLRISPKVETRLDELGRPVEGVVVTYGFGYPRAIERLLAAVKAAVATGTAGEQCEAFFALAAALLRRAHDVSLSTACELLTVPEDDLTRLVEAVMAVVNDGARSQGSQVQGTSHS